MPDSSYSGRNAAYGNKMAGHERAIRTAELDYARQIQAQQPDISRDEAQRIAAKWARKDFPLT